MTAAKLPRLIRRLISAAVAARKNAYCPHSGYPVGASVLTDSGSIFAGCNVESQTLISHICAERAAIYNALSHGKRGIRAVCTTSPGSLPCGTCRQMILEFGSDRTLIYSLVTGPNSKKNKLVTTTIAELIPHAHTVKQIRAFKHK